MGSGIELLVVNFGRVVDYVRDDVRRVEAIDTTINGKVAEIVYS